MPCIVESEASACAMIEWRLEIDRVESKKEEEDKDTKIVVSRAKGDKIDFDSTTAPPTSPDCMVVGFTTCGQWHVFIHFISREPTWRIYSLNFGGDDPYSYYLPTFCGHDVYALCNNEGVNAFRDMNEGDDYSWDQTLLQY
ncbi:hypothetical protein L1987_84175 [Smallanthus sonchifolius]|uniref:Uncharacterized protein n=1 Tax=Smallanthus sonchifolius TaxID=185202 RepID=A0ACB8YE69_9ASTR|nr:hypothetical protein L1987_84175 [Smallanthus sonchifolius]